MTYHMLVPESQVRLFWVYFSKSKPVRVDTSYYFVAPSVDAGFRYLIFGDINDLEENVGWWAIPSAQVTWIILLSLLIRTIDISLR